MEILDRFEEIEKSLSSINVQDIPDDNLVNLFLQVIYTSLDVIETNKKILKGELK